MAFSVDLGKPNANIIIRLVFCVFHLHTKDKLSWFIQATSSDETHTLINNHVEQIHFIHQTDHFQIYFINWYILENFIQTYRLVAYSMTQTYPAPGADEFFSYILYLYCKYSPSTVSGLFHMSDLFVSPNILIRSG